MTGSSRRRQLIGRFTVALLAIAGAACDQFPRTNPFDPQAQVALVLDGPDSVTAVGDTVTFEVRSAEGLPLNELVHWTVPSFLQQIDLRGRFVTIGMQTGARGTGTVTATINANVVSKPFVFSQQVASLSVTDCSGNRTVSFAALMRPLDQQFGSKFACVDLLDRRGGKVSDPASVSGIIRDSRVARFVSADQRRFNAAAVGSTYVVYTRSGLSDSIRVNVRQVPVSLTPDPVACVSTDGVRLTPGQSVQLKALPPLRDANGIAIEDPVVVQSVLASLQWAATPSLRVTVGQDGLVTARDRGFGYVIASYDDGATARGLSYCLVAVN